MHQEGGAGRDGDLRSFPSTRSEELTGRIYREHVPCVSRRRDGAETAAGTALKNKHIPEPPRQVVGKPDIDAPLKVHRIGDVLASEFFLYAIRIHFHRFNIISPHSPDRRL